MYKIKISYQTGDSFSNEDTEDHLDYSWKKLDIVKQNLRRIKEHNEWVQSKDSWNEKELPVPKWWNAGNPNDTIDCYNINLLLDNGNEVKLHCFWQGYFERLYGAEIEPCESDMKFSVN